MKNINVNLWKKDVTIISNEDCKIETKYKKCFFNPIIVTNNKDELTIKGSIIRIWLIAFLQIMLLIGLLVVFCFLLRPLIIKNYLWYTANIVLACLVQALVMIFISLIYNDNKITIKIPKDYKINNFKINTKIVNLFLEDISVNNLSLNLINSNIKIKGSNFNNIDLNLINSKIDFKECNSLNTHAINNFKTKITKGKVDINGLRINNLETIVNRGQILMENMIINNDDLTLRSGAILYKDVNINYGLKTNMTSGEFNACKIAFNNFDLKLTTGRVNFDNITGKEDDYNITSKIKSGVFNIDNQKFIYKGILNTKKMQTVDVNLISGKINLNFNQ